MDKLTKEQRKKNMQANKSTGTKPEILLAKTLFARGHRYRKNDKTVFGKPDLTFKKIKLAIFVDGEFWYGKNWQERRNDHKTNQEFWINKFNKNMQNDIKHYKQLEQMDIKVIVIWECELKECFDYRMESLLEEIKNDE